MHSKSLQQNEQSGHGIKLTSRLTMRHLSSACYTDNIHILTDFLYITTRTIWYDGLDFGVDLSQQPSIHSTTNKTNWKMS